jgi:predicted amidophosphoribosyltransferase
METQNSGVPENYLLEPVVRGIPRVDKAQWFAWVLSEHWDQNRGARSVIGDLVSNAKYHADSNSLSRLGPIVRHAALQLRQLPNNIHSLAKIDVVMAIPFFGSKTISVPHSVADEISEAFSIPNYSDLIKKKSSTGQAKLNPVVNPNVYEALRRLDGLNVLLVDDLFRTGSTLESVAIKVREAGAKSVTGFCLTKAYKGLN